MKTLRTFNYILITLYLTIILSCNKKERLEESPSSKIQLPNSLKELQALLDNDLVFNESPSIGEASADNYYLTYPTWQALTQKEQHTYTWATDIFMGTGGVSDWNTPYEQIFYTNIILQALKKIEKKADNQQQWNAIQGAAYFLRGNAYYELAQLFILPYDTQTAASDLGLPLRLSDDITEILIRASIKQTYEQIISDVSISKNLLPQLTDTAHPNRPSLAAAMALLSKTYLSMSNYDSAGIYADSYLSLHNQLLDYNTLNTNILFPFKTNNPEIVFYSQSSTNNTLMALISRGTIIDSLLYSTYDVNDLRRNLFYTINSDNKPIIRSSYTGKTFPFTGLATDEIILIRAECRARSGNITGALTDLNTLLQNRWKKNTFIPYSNNTTIDALQLILTERKKELPFRNVRWMDLRRLNKEGRSITLRRIINGNEYVLPPNNIRYVLPIPPDVIQQSNMPQNPR